jgi:5-formyltetrahydrofolate cyclo-ligase
VIDQREGLRVTKRALRAELQARRASRDPRCRARLADSLVATALGQPRLAAAARICAYVGVGDEPVTGSLLDALRTAGVAVLLPILAPEFALDWARYDGAEALAPGPFGLLQPVGPRLGTDAAAAADLLLVPALAVDELGRRLGRGGGYYDRLLARLAGAAAGVATAGPPPAWAIVYDEEVLDRVPGEPHDVPVDAALTPSALRPLGRPGGPRLALGDNSGDAGGFAESERRIHARDTPGGAQ